jgi:hypothetical protein
VVGPEESVEVRFEATDEVEKVMLMEPVEE